MLSPLESLVKFIREGMDFPDAAWRVCRDYKLSDEEYQQLAEDYDNLV